MRRIAPEELCGIDRDIYAALGPVQNDAPIDSRNKLPKHWWELPEGSSDAELSVPAKIATTAIAILLAMDD